MKKINSAAASYYYPNGISDDQADTYIDTDSNENNAGAGGSLLKRKDFLGVDESASHHPNRTYYYKKQNLDLDEIIDTCTKKLMHEPKNTKALYLRGTAYSKKRQYANAIRDLTAAIDNDSQHVEALYDRGLTFSKIGQQDLAIADFSLVLHLNPDHVNAAFGRAACYNTMGLFSQAIEDYNFALLKDQNNNSQAKVNTRSADDNRNMSPGASPHGSSDAILVNDVLQSPMSPMSTYHGYHGGSETDTQTHSLQSPAATSRSAANLADDASISSEKSKATVVTASGRVALPVRNPNRPPPAVPVYASPFISTRTDIIHPNNPYLQVQLQQLQQQQQKQIEQEAAEEHHAKGFQFRKQGDFRSAIVEYSKAIECDPRHFKAHFNRGFAYEKLDFSQEAIRDYSKAIEINGANAFTYYNRGISLDRIHQYEKACADFSQAIALQPNNIDFYHNRACCLRKLDRWHDAVEDYSISLKITPNNNFKALFNRFICYEKLGQVDLAMKDCQAALTLQPDHLGCLTNRALLNEKIGEVDASIADVNHAMDLGGPLVSLLVIRARLKFKLHRLDDAIEDLNTAIQMQPNDLNLLFSRAIFFKACESFLPAIHSFSEIIDLLLHSDKEVEGRDTYSEENILSGLSSAHNHRGFCHRQLNQMEEALFDYSEAIRLYPDNTRAYNNRAYMFAQDHKYELAIADYTAVLRIDPYNAHAYHNRGLAFDKIGSFDQAIADFTKVMGMDSRGSSGDDIDLYEAKYPDNNVPTFLQRPLDFFNNNNNNISSGSGGGSGSSSTNNKVMLEFAVRPTRPTIRFQDEVSVVYSGSNSNMISRKQPNANSITSTATTTTAIRAVQPNLSPLKISIGNNNNTTTVGNTGMLSGRSRTPMSHHFITKALGTTNTTTNTSTTTTGPQSRTRDDQAINIRSPSNFNPPKKPSKRDGKPTTTTSTTPMHAGAFLSSLKVPPPLPPGQSSSSSSSSSQPPILKPIAVRPAKESLYYIDQPPLVAQNNYENVDMAFIPLHPSPPSTTTTSAHALASHSNNNDSSGGGGGSSSAASMASNAYHPGKSTRPHHVSFAKGKFSQTNIMVAK